MVSRSWSRGGVEGGGWEGTGVDIIMMEARDNAQPRPAAARPRGVLLPCPCPVGLSYKPFVMHLFIQSLFHLLSLTNFCRVKAPKSS